MTRTPSAPRAAACSSAARTSRDATPWPCALGTTPKRRSMMPGPESSKSSAPTGRPSSVASSPPYAASSAATDASSSEQRVGGRVEHRPGTERLADHREHVGRGRGVDEADLDGHSPSSAWSAAAARDQLVQRGVDLLVPLEDHHVAGARRTRRAGSRR